MFKYPRNGKHLQSCARHIDPEKEAGVKLADEGLSVNLSFRILRDHLAQKELACRVHKVRDEHQHCNQQEIPMLEDEAKSSRISNRAPGDFGCTPLYAGTPLPAMNAICQHHADAEQCRSD